ncbi:MAG: hypothetical protein IIC75_00390 [Bacteroidetes bacterium]|nr:hypothetical protein [Bacteroidota bacterium]
MNELLDLNNPRDLIDIAQIWLEIKEKKNKTAKAKSFTRKEINDKMSELFNLYVK